MPRSSFPSPAAALAGALSIGLAACAVGPDYVRPTLDVPTGYKEAGQWKTAQPRPAASDEPWWRAYGDTTLDGLMRDAEAANLNLRVAEAQYREARAAADEARAALFPAIGASVSATRARVDSPIIATGNAFGASLGGSWEPDLWGGIRRSVEAGEDTAQASLDDLAAAHLSIQTSLAQDYFQLRMTDRLRDLYAATTTAYAKALTLTKAQYGAGVALRSDVALAESQLTTAQAQAVDLEASRALLEHAIASLLGRAPAQFALPSPDPQHAFDAPLPATPIGLPSELLEHRPDIAGAERRAAAANAQIGVAQAAYFPTLTLSASGGGATAALGQLFDAPSRVWSIGATLAETIFDGGARRARDAAAVAAWDAAAATYKQTVLTSFQQVEDDLANLRILDQEAQYQDAAVRASQLAESLALTQYRAGTATYLSVVTAQQLSLTNQRTAVQLRGRQVAASIGLVTATGGGWTTSSGLAPVAPFAASAASAPTSASTFLVPPSAASS